MALLSSSFQLTPEQTAVTLSNARQTSFIQRLGQQVPMSLAGGSGVAVGDITGGFVGTEGGAKPVQESTVSTVPVPVREWAVLIPVGKRVIDANPGGVVDIIQDKLAQALARAFDTLAVTGGGYAGATYLNQTGKTVSLNTATRGAGGVFTDLNGGLALLADDGKNYTGSLFDYKAEPKINASVDLDGRPVFIDVPPADSNPAYRPGRLLGRPAEFVQGLATGTPGDAAEVVGYMGDWSKVLWGIVGGLELSLSDSASFTDGTNTISAYQNNLYVIKAEALLGVAVADTDSFVKVLRGAATQPAEDA